MSLLDCLLSWKVENFLDRGLFLVGVAFTDTILFTLLNATVVADLFFPVLLLLEEFGRIFVTFLEDEQTSLSMCFLLGGFIGLPLRYT